MFSIEEQVIELLGAPNDAAVTAFFKGIVPDTVEVRPDAGNGRGKGVFAITQINEDGLILKDPPLVAIQDDSTRSDARVCGNCMRLIGGIGKQLASVIGGADDRQDAIQNEEPSESRLSRQQLTYLENLELPGSEQWPMPSVIACQGGCCQSSKPDSLASKILGEGYCSEECSLAAWDGHHLLLCPGKAACSSLFKGSVSTKAEDVQTQKEAFEEFYEHAKQTNDVFRLAAQAVAKVLLQANREAEKLKEQQTNLENTIEDHEIHWNALQRAWVPFAMGYKKLWWGCVALPEDVDPADEDFFRQDMSDLAKDSLELLHAALHLRAPTLVAAFPAVLDLRIWGSLIGMYELNNLNLFVRSPLQEWVETVEDLPEEVWVKVSHPNLSPDASRDLVMKVRDFIQENPEEIEAASCQGNAFHSIQACINHSCVPNAHAFKRDEDIDGSAVILALKDIQPGEEITISYIDEEESLEERRAALADYGFVCQCEKCIAESSSTDS